MDTNLVRGCFCLHYVWVDLSKQTDLSNTYQVNKLNDLSLITV